MSNNPDKAGFNWETVLILGSDPNALGGTPGTPLQFLIRTDIPTLYYYAGPLDTNWVPLTGTGTGPNPVLLTNNNGGALPIGTPVFSSSNDGMNAARANDLTSCIVLGLVQDITVAAGAVGKVTTNGLLTATADQWDVVTGNVGGLTFNTIYYVDPVNPGKLVKIKPTTAGAFLAPVGVAISTTEMIVAPIPPTQIGGGDGLTLLNAFVGAVVIGAPVYSSASGSFNKAKADAAATSLVVGLVGQAPSIPIVSSGLIQTSGPLTATTVQWDAVTGDVGGLTFNSLYYVDPVIAGKLTKTAPVAVGQVVAPVGRAVSTTTMVIDVLNTTQL